MVYLDVDEYMPLTQDLGARIAVHPADSYPFPDVFGYNAPAGFTSSFGIRLVYSAFLDSCVISSTLCCFRKRSNGWSRLMANAA